MSDTDFTIRLAPGLYMDSMGRFLPGPVDGAPTHPAPRGGLPIDPDAAKKALQGIADALPKTGDPKSQQALLDLGVPDEVIQALGKIGEIAGTLAKVVPVVGAAVTVAKMLGILKSGDDAVLAAIDKLWVKFSKLIEAKDEKWTTHEVFKLRNDLYATLDEVTEFQGQVQQGLLSPQILLDKLSEMRALHTQSANAVRALMSPTLWQSSLDGEKFKWVWPGNLFFDPGPGEPGPDMRALRPPAEEERFDHRVMAPSVCATTQVYLTFIKKLAPEFRSSGEFSESIWRTTLRLEDLIVLMLNKTVARTHWFPQEFVYLYPVHPQNPPGGVFVPNYNGYHVGALDLRSTRGRPTTPPIVPYGFGWIFDMTGAQVQWGSVQFNWHPPAKVVLEDHGNQGSRFRVLNPDECAKAANTRSEELFAAALYAAGYFHLVQLSGLLRQLYTAPSTSETVTGVVTPYRSPLPSDQVTVTGVPVPPYPPATSPATRVPQQTFIRANLNTQPRAARTILFPYKVWLRTLPADANANSDYKSVFHTHYDDEAQPREPGTAPFKRLVCEFDAAGVLAQEMLVEGETPEAVVTVGSKDVTLTADTFDWWIPIPEVVQSLPQMSEYSRHLREHGWLAPKEAAAPAKRPGKWADFTLVQDVMSESPVSDAIAGQLVHAPGVDPVGERRMIRRTQVTVSCSLSWNGIDLIVRVEGDPADRNFDLFLVIEERLGDHEVWLHTPFLVPVTGQLTFVPEKFFKDEQALIEQSSEFWNDFNSHYRESRLNLSPLDAITQINSWRDRSTVEGLQRIAAVVDAGEPELLAAFKRSRGF